MNHHCLNASIPQHIYGYVEQGILRGDVKTSDKFDDCIIFGITSIPSRALHFSIMTEVGSQWARIPLHKLRHKKPETNYVHHITELQTWDCHGWDFSITQYEYLREMKCEYRTRNGLMVPAGYWCTLDHTDNGFSQYPPEHKCYHLLLLNDGSGQIAAQPNNRILWKDDSFTRPNPEILKEFRVMPENIWHAEAGRNADLNSFTNNK